MYEPGACPAATARVAPTVNVWVPPELKVPVADGKLVKVVTFMLFDPLLIVTVDVGRVIAYVKDAAPATSKLAAATVPVVAGRVTPPPPPVVRLPVGSRITVPPVVADTATFPKFRSIVLVMEIGVMIVADADAVAVACANELVLNPIITAAASTTLLMFFIFYVF